MAIYHSRNIEWDILCDVKLNTHIIRIIKHPNLEKYGWLIPCRLAKQFYSATRTCRYFNNYEDAQKSLLIHLKRENINLAELEVLPPSPRKFFNSKSKLPPKTTQIVLTSSERRPVYSAMTPINKQYEIRRAMR